MYGIPFLNIIRNLKVLKRFLSVIPVNDTTWTIIGTGTGTMTHSAEIVSLPCWEERRRLMLKLLQPYVDLTTRGNDDKVHTFCLQSDYVLCTRHDSSSSPLQQGALAMREAILTHTSCTHPCRASIYPYCAPPVSHVLFMWEDTC